MKEDNDNGFMRPRQMAVQLSELRARLRRRGDLLSRCVIASDGVMPGSEVDALMEEIKKELGYNATSGGGEQPCPDKQ